MVFAQARISGIQPPQSRASISAPLHHRGTCWVRAICALALLDGLCAWLVTCGVLGGFKLLSFKLVTLESGFAQAPPPCVVFRLPATMAEKQVPI